jgi:hypothetical protein
LLILHSLLFDVLTDGKETCSIKSTTLKPLDSDFSSKYTWVLNKVSAAVRGTLLVVQLVEALRYNPEGRGFDSRVCH